MMSSDQAHDREAASPSRVCRREFMAASARLGAGVTVGSTLLAATSECLAKGTAEADGKVVIARRDGLAAAASNDLHRAAIEMLDGSVCDLTGHRKPRDAWRSLFGRRDRVGIKTNALAGPRLSPRRGVIEAVIHGLRMAGVEDGSIIVFDRYESELEACGWPVNRRGGVRCLGTDSLRGSGYEEGLEVLPHMASCFSMVLTRLCTAVVNVPILKDHDLSGVSAAMKNFYGVIHNPNKYHLNNCNPYIAELASHPQIRDKVRLNVCDAIRPQYDGGPSHKPRTVWPCNALLVARDMVAMDRVGAEIIEAKRQKKGLPSLIEAGRPPAYIETAAKLGVGVADASRIQRVDI